MILFSPTCSFIRIRQASQENRKEPSPIRYIDDVLSLYNSRFGDFVDRIYPIELEKKDITDTDRSASYLDLHLKIESEGRLRTKLYDKRDEINFPFVNFPFIATFKQHLNMEYIFLS